MSSKGALERAPLAGRRALVLGLGRFAGGLETVRFLCAEGADVLVSDAAERDALADSVAAAEDAGARVRCGPQTPDLLADRDLLLVNPAIPFEHPVIKAARERGVAMTTEINIVLARCRAPVHAVTGTKGKSTTAALLASMLAEAGEVVHLGGNIGRPLIGQLEDIAPSDHVVLELSSFQLWWARHVRAAPQTTLVTNLLSDHLDRHGTQAAYAEAKRAALDYQGPTHVAVLPADDEAVRAAGWWEAGRARRVSFGRGGDFQIAGTRVRHTQTQVEVELAGLPFLGAHNLRNALAATAALLALRPEAAAAARAGALAARPLPHRLDPVAEIDGVLYVDDSNATHPDSALRALEAVADQSRPIVLIAGGKEKGSDPAALFEGMRRHAKAVVAIGSSAARILGEVGGHLPVVPGGTMESAVGTAASLADEGDAVLLSPGYSSLDEYVSFAERGDRFRAAVERLRDA